MNNDKQELNLEEGQSGSGEADQLQSDPPVGHERTPPATKGLQEIFNDLNSSNQEVKNGVQLLSAEFMKTKDREALRTKKVELENQLAIYKREFESLNQATLSAANQAILKAQKTNMDTYEATIVKFFSDAMHMDKQIQKAYQQVEELAEIFQVLKHHQEAATTDFLKTASARELRDGKAEYDKEYLNYLRKCLQINQQDLVKEAREEVIKQKEEVEKITTEMDKLLTKAIADKERSEQSPPADHAQKIEHLSKQIENLHSEKERDRQAAEKKIIALQEQLEQRSEPSMSEISYDADDEKVGVQQQQGEDNKEQGVMNLKIDSVQMPYFSGNFEDWENFKDMFVYLVHNSKKISKVVKFHELRTHLKGAAFETIRGYQLTGANYDAAWADLTKRYDRTDELVEDYIRKFLEAPVIEQKATYITLRSIIDATNQMLRALPSSGVSIHHWDPFVNLIIKTKLDGNTRSEWQQKQVREQLKKSRDLLDFLENRAIEIRPGQGERLSQMLKGECKRNAPKKVFQVNKKEPEGSSQPEKKCPHCSHPHLIFECFKFKKETAKNRSVLVKKFKLCFKCLFPHKYATCSKVCKNCGGPHHVMLCFKRENEAKGENQRAGSSQQQYQQKPTQKPTDWAKESWNQPSNSKN